MRGSQEPGRHGAVLPASVVQRALERGRRSTRAVMLAIAQMYIRGVSTRDVEKVMAEFGMESLSSAQVSRATALMDEELEAWRNRPLGAFPYLFLDARYEKARIDGIVRDVAILSAIGIGEDGRRSVPGLSVALSEAEIHWRGFLDGLVTRGLRGVRFVTSDDHAGLAAARRAVFAGATWQRCQFHLARGAPPGGPRPECHPSRADARHSQGHRTPAQGRLERLRSRRCRGRTHPHRSGIRRHRPETRRVAGKRHSRRSDRLFPAGKSLAQNADRHPPPLGGASPACRAMIERAIQQELKRRTRKIRVFPNEASLERLATAILVEIDEQWIAADRAYLTMDNRDG